MRVLWGQAACGNVLQMLVDRLQDNQAAAFLVQKPQADVQMDSYPHRCLQAFALRVHPCAGAMGHAAREDVLQMLADRLQDDPASCPGAAGADHSCSAGAAG